MASKKEKITWAIIGTVIVGASTVAANLGKLKESFSPKKADTLSVSVSSNSGQVAISSPGGGDQVVAGHVGGDLNFKSTVTKINITQMFDPVALKLAEKEWTNVITKEYSPRFSDLVENLERFAKDYPIGFRVFRAIDTFISPITPEMSGAVSVNLADARLTNEVLNGISSKFVVMRNLQMEGMAIQNFHLGIPDVVGRKDVLFSVNEVEIVSELLGSKNGSPLFVVGFRKRPNP